jgi:hypothetical protein
MRGNRLILYRTIGYLWHTAWPDGKNRFRATEQAAQLASVKLQTRVIAASAEIDQAITALKLNGMTTSFCAAVGAEADVERPDQSITFGDLHVNSWSRWAFGSRRVAPAAAITLC